MAATPDHRQFQSRLAGLGYTDLDELCVAEALAGYRELKASRAVVDDEEIETVVDDVVARQRPRIRFVSIDLHSGSVEHRAEARIVLEVDGETRSAEGHGDGPVHAAFRAIRTAVPHRANLNQFSVASAGPGPDAVAIAGVRLEEHGRIVEGRGEDTDTIVAATQAFVHALNKLASKTETSVQVSPAFLTA